MARLIYSKQTSATAQQVLSDIYCDLGDLQMENEQFESAIADYMEALDLLQKHESKDQTAGLRALASVHFKISMAHEYRGDLDAALSPLEMALSHLQSCTSSDAELAELVKELGMKLADIKSSIEKADVLKKQVVDDSGAAGFKPAAAQGAQVNDLSNLVKKRKAPQASEGEVAKKSNTGEQD
jgi:tetratricopeptide (TPR) repeat protein